MKYFYLLLALIIIGCKQDNRPSPEQANTNDTISLASGLQYYYLKKGEGRQVEKGSLVDTKLSLRVKDSTVWTSYEDTDSLFSFIVGHDPVIDGFEEMALLMREGDNVVAILPDSLAYGDKGAGDDIPPHSTLIYDRYEMVGVSTPRKVLTDTLNYALDHEGVEGVIATYQGIVSSADADQYHSELAHLGAFMRSLYIAKKYAEVEAICTHFIEVAEKEVDKELFGYYYIISTQKQGKYDEAIAMVNRFLEDELEEEEWLLDRLSQLQEAKEAASKD